MKRVTKSDIKQDVLMLVKAKRLHPCAMPIRSDEKKGESSSTVVKKVMSVVSPV